MTPEQQRIAIAEVCEWTLINATGQEPAGFDPAWVAQGLPAAACMQTVPDYLNDLNAMHEAEKVLDNQPSDVRSLFLDHLSTLVEFPLVTTAPELKFELQYFSVRATATQRAEAFLRTLNLWVD